MGPSEQLTPTTLAPHSFASRATSPASVPSAMRPLSIRETRVATTGTLPSAASTAASTATRSSEVCRIVSTRSPSTPASTSARACSRKTALTVAQIARAFVRAAEEVAAGPHRAEHVRVAGSRFACDAHTGDVELAHARSEPVLLESQSVGAERVRLDDLRARPQIVLVHLGDELGAGDVQLLEARVVEDAPLVELGPHGAVDDQHTGTDGVEEEARWA